MNGIPGPRVCSKCSVGPASVARGLTAPAGWHLSESPFPQLLSGDGNSPAHGAVVSCGGRGVGSGRPGTWYLAPCLAGAEHLLLPLK